MDLCSQKNLLIKGGDEIIPKNLCPFAYFSIIPYFIAFTYGAWFRWQKNKNEVVCQCPMPQGPVFLVKRIIHSGKITVQAEVKSLGNFTCPYRYSAGEVFKIGKMPLRLKDLILQKNYCSNLSKTLSSLRVRVVDFKAPCLFFRKRGEEFGLNELTPEGICPDLFFHLYPQYLTLLYDGSPSETTICCPGTKGKTVWRIRKKPLILAPLLNLAENFFRLIGHPKDLIDKKIIIELLKSEGICPKGYKGKITFSFNHYSHLFGSRYFCPALFYTLYPFLDSGAKNLRLQCPAENSAIVVELRK
jgi:uncharacterized repeat protein (TIGR04076 family)